MPVSSRVGHEQQFCVVYGVFQQFSMSSSLCFGVSPASTTCQPQHSKFGTHRRFSASDIDQRFGSFDSFFLLLCDFSILRCLLVITRHELNVHSRFSLHSASGPHSWILPVKPSSRQRQHFQSTRNLRFGIPRYCLHSHSTSQRAGYKSRLHNRPITSRFSGVVTSQFFSLTRVQVIMEHIRMRSILISAWTLLGAYALPSKGEPTPYE